jgi:hypothetical protein
MPSNTWPTRRISHPPDADDWAAQLHAVIGHDIYQESNTNTASVVAIAKAQTLMVVATQDQMG